MGCLLSCHTAALVFWAVCCLFRNTVQRHLFSALTQLSPKVEDGIPSYGSLPVPAENWLTPAERSDIVPETCAGITISKCL